MRISQDHDLQSGKRPVAVMVFCIGMVIMVSGWGYGGALYNFGRYGYDLQGRIAAVNAVTRRGDTASHAFRYKEYYTISYVYRDVAREVTWDHSSSTKEPDYIVGTTMPIVVNDIAKPTVVHAFVTSHVLRWQGVLTGGLLMFGGLGIMVAAVIVFVRATRARKKYDTLLLK